ncbi:5-carboxymethyl-2-hydroxymuconate isomerase [Endozoicomonas sp. OPT23]|uniref:5-carboxymethyl-2-hydroxymuconate Delta-isomerase n=1 Tax=Endozoicomonas sp. OPT23 TaxID=2072845 RepID=UPI00129BC2DC|nr:5-carboxymethyl-2-hydroxymuconate Delta-isomerase [Endozoicomonas sp. OPT23]MRI31859.1 5-carboxymethyl-2-hydroxymuconate isomerase [Endozoicomonas sp. OPT23]
MPHCIVEYSAELEGDLSISQLINTAHEAVLSSELFRPEDTKSRAYPCYQYRTVNSDDSFIHVVVKILPGRETEIRNSLSQSVLSAVSKFASDVNIVTVEVVDLDESYTKVIR